VADPENDSGKQNKKWNDEDRRLLLITFVGGLASIIVGAATLGLIVTLARLIGPGHSLTLWLILLATTGIAIVGTVLSLRRREKGRIDHVLMWVDAIIATTGILIIIGVTAGIK
jgi:hypothetical protein